MKLPSTPERIVAAAVVLALGLVGVVVREGMARAQGQEVACAITGYDPREPADRPLRAVPAALGHFPADAVSAWRAAAIDPLAGRLGRDPRASQGTRSWAQRPAQPRGCAASWARWRCAATMLGVVTTAAGGRRDQLGDPVTSAWTACSTASGNRPRRSRRRRCATPDGRWRRPGRWSPSARDGKARLKGVTAGGRVPTSTWF